MESGAFERIWEDRWRISAWLVPAITAVAFAHYAVLPLASRLQESRSRLETLRENTYVPAWLDSTRASLALDAEALREFSSAREAALTSGGGVQATVDRIRGLAQGSGIEVVKTTPVLGKSGALRLIKVRIEGYSRYPGLLAFFHTLKTSHPDLYLEEMIIRQGRDRSGSRLEGHLVVHVHDRPSEGNP